MRDARVLILVASCVSPLCAEAAGKHAEGPQSALEFFQQLFSDAPPAAQTGAGSAASVEEERPPEPQRAPVPFDEEEEPVEASDADIPARNPAFDGRFGDSAPPPARAVPAPTPREPVTQRPAVAVPVREPRMEPAARRPPGAESPAPRTSEVRQVRPPAAAALTPVPPRQSMDGDVFVDEDDLMEDEGILEIEDITAE